MVGTGLLVSASFVAPNLPMAFKKGKSKQNYRRSFQNIYDKNLIYLSGEKVHLSEKGQKLMEQTLSEEIELKKHEWDGIWRIVSYDILEDKKKERNYFRRKLTSLGFVELQKSMMVILYECKEEIAIIAQNLGVSPYVMHLITDNLPRQKEFIRRFSLEAV